MVGAGQGFGVPGGIEETPNSIGHPPYGERGATLTSKIWIGTDVLSPATALRAKVASIAEQEFEGDLLEIAQFDGTDRTHMKDIDIIESGWGFSDKFSKMDVREMKSAYLRANGMLLTNPLTPITGRSSANSMEHFNLYLDSGASRHMVSNPALLINHRDPPAGTDQFKCADGVHLAVIGYGDIEMENFRIPDVCLVQGLTANLISVGQVARTHKVWSCFSRNECNLMLPDGSRIGGAIRRDDNQYILRFMVI